MSSKYYEGVGRRKTSIARVRVFSGPGEITVNGKIGAEYFPRIGDLQILMGPLHYAGQEGRMSVSVLVQGGGTSGQVGAVRQGLARALMTMNGDYRPVMRRHGFLTRDDRIKERKKPGLKRARKAPTFTKR